MMKQIRPPDRPPTPYMRFSRKIFPKVRNEHPDSPIWDITKIVGQLWRDASEAERAAYCHEFEMDKIEYEKQLKTYQATLTQQQQQMGINKIPQRSGKPNVDKSRGGRVDTMGGVVIQPVDEDDMGDSGGGMLARRVAGARYERNQRLMQELFSRSVVPDSRALVGQARLEMLRKQAGSLSQHQEKLEDELRKLEDAFNDKKKQMIVASENFSEALDKVESEKPDLGETKYEELVGQWSKKLLDAYEEHKKREGAASAAAAAASEEGRTEKSVLYSLTMDSPKDKEATQSAPAPPEAAASATSEAEKEASTDEGTEKKDEATQETAEPMETDEKPEKDAVAPSGGEPQSEDSEAKTAPPPPEASS